MRKLFLIAIAFVCSFGSFGQANKYVKFEAEINNRNSDTIYIKNNYKFTKKIVINPEGLFKDTLNVKDGSYYINDGKESTELYLKNGYNLKMKMDAKEFDESIVYTGKGEAENNVLVKRTLLFEKYLSNEVSILDEADFKKAMEEKELADSKLLSNPKLDIDFVVFIKKDNEMRMEYLQKNHKRNYEANLAKIKMNNTVSPPFDYENHIGGKTKLDDLKGKYVYVDVWATWCGPCRAEIPSLKAIEEKYHGKNIEFVSISIDVAKDHDKWKVFVTDKNLGGVQLFADKDWNSDFMKGYGVTSIPRFILIDPNGKIVKGDAARPSDPELRKELDRLLN
jgi:thiol-disulfide isomerase/thioredoxin